MRDRRSFPKIFERIGSRLIGLYEVTSVAGLAGLSIAMICDTFHCPGKWPVRSMLLYMYVIAFSPISGRCLRAVPVMRSYPGAFIG